MNNSVFFKISRNQMNRALTILNNAYNKLKESKEEEIITTKILDKDSNIIENKEINWDYRNKKDKLQYYLEVANFSIKQTKLKSFYVDYGFAKLIKSVLFIEEKEVKQ